MLTAAIILAFALVFVLLPCAVIPLLLFRRKSIRDFDRLKKAPGGWYAPYIKGILSDMAFMRSLDMREVSVTAYDGVALKADWLDVGSNKTAVLFHGFCSTPLNNFSVLGRQLYLRGWNLLLVCQRGHNKSGGSHTSLGVKEQYDVIKWVEKAGELAPNAKILLCGVSMGGTAVSYASDKLSGSPVRAMLIDCCFCSPYEQMLADMGRTAFIWKPFMPLVTLASKLIYGIDIKLRTVDTLKHTDIPAVFMTGLADTTVAPQRFMANYEACASEKLLITVPGAQHALAFAAAQSDERSQLFSFIDRRLAASVEAS